MDRNQRSGVGAAVQEVTGRGGMGGNSRQGNSMCEVRRDGEWCKRTRKPLANGRYVLDGLE